jgi:hypothetical protein
MWSSGLAAGSELKGANSEGERQGSPIDCRIRYEGESPQHGQPQAQPLARAFVTRERLQLAAPGIDRFDFSPLSRFRRSDTRHKRTWLILVLLVAPLLAAAVSVWIAIRVEDMREHLKLDVGAFP